MRRAHILHCANNYMVIAAGYGTTRLAKQLELINLQGKLNKLEAQIQAWVSDDDPSYLFENREYRDYLRDRIAELRRELG